VQYRLLGQVIEIINGLLVKWGMVSKRGYLYRTSGRVLSIRMIDLAEMNSDFVTLDTLWLSLKVIDKPLIGIVNESVIQYSQILKKAFFDLLVFLVHLNRSNFEETPSIEGYVAAHCKKLVHLGLIGNPESKKPAYVSLKPTMKHYLT
jgi:hypothetical protein